MQGERPLWSEQVQMIVFESSDDIMSIHARLIKSFTGLVKRCTNCSRASKKVLPLFITQLVQNIIIIFVVVVVVVVIIAMLIAFLFIANIIKQNIVIVIRCLVTVIFIHCSTAGWFKEGFGWQLHCVIEAADSVHFVKRVWKFVEVFILLIIWCSIVAIPRKDLGQCVRRYICGCNRQHTFLSSPWDISILWNSLASISPVWDLPWSMSNKVK